MSEINYEPSLRTTREALEQELAKEVPDREYIAWLKDSLEWLEERAANNA